jgi:hypothetical protein
VLLALIAVGMIIFAPERVEDAKALLTAAGLFGIGHGIHRVAKRLG